MKTARLFITIFSCFILYGRAVFGDALDFDYFIIHPFQKMDEIQSNDKSDRDRKLYISPDLLIHDSAFEKSLEDFSFDGSPIGLVSRLRKIDRRIAFSRIYGPANLGKIDISTRLVIENFSGTILELLITAFPDEYSRPIWVARMDKDGNVLMEFGGPIAGTPRLSKLDGIEFIPPSSRK